MSFGPRRIPVGVLMLAVAMCVVNMVRPAKAEGSVVAIQAGGPWWFYPVFGPSHNVLGMLAIAEQGTTVADNFAVVWVEKHSDGSEWTAVGWKAGQEHDAVKYARGRVGVADALGTLLPDLTVAQNGEIAAPKEMKCGFASDDPIGAAISILCRSDAVMLTEALADAGYEAAPLLSSLAQADAAIDAEPIDECGGLNSLLDQVSEQASMLESGASAASVFALSWCWPCTCSYSTSFGGCTGWWLDYTTPAIGGVTCHWVRTCTRTDTFTGRYWYCPSCASGPTIVNFEETTRTNALSSSECVAP